MPEGSPTLVGFGGPSMRGLNVSETRPATHFPMAPVTCRRVVMLVCPGLVSLRAVADSPGKPHTAPLLFYWVVFGALELLDCLRAW
jgi:hypothetical protein